MIGDELMICVSCGRIANQMKCHRCWLVENLNREYLKEIEAGNHQQANTIVEEVMYVQASEKKIFNRRLYTDETYNVFCLTYRDVKTAHVPVFGSDQVLEAHRQWRLDRGFVECSAGAFEAVCEKQERQTQQ